MKENKKPKYFRLSEGTLSKIKAVEVERNCNQTAALEHIVNQYYADRVEQHHMMMVLFDELLERKLNEKLEQIKEDTKRIRIAANVSDRNIQMMMEFWNHYFIVNDFKTLGTTDKIKTDELKEAETLISKRISESRQKKIDSQNKRKIEATENINEGDNK